MSFTSRVTCGPGLSRVVVAALISTLVMLSAIAVVFRAPSAAATASGLAMPPVCTTSGPFPYEQSYPPPPLALFAPATDTYCRAGNNLTGAGLESPPLDGNSTSVTFTMTPFTTIAGEYCVDVECKSKAVAQFTSAIFWPEQFNDAGQFATVTSADTPWEPTTHGWRFQPKELDFRLDRVGTCGTEGQSNVAVSNPASLSCTYTITWFHKPTKDAVVSFGNLHLGLASDSLGNKGIGGVCFKTDPTGPYDRCGNFSSAGVLEAMLLFSGTTTPVTPPTVDFTAVPSGSPLDIQFTATATAMTGATITSYAWDFGDNKTGTGAAPLHHYDAPGTYHATVSVTDSNGQHATVGRDVVISAKLVVNSVADTANGATSGQVCDTGATVGTPPVPECTLRAALEAANSGTSSQAITFAIPNVSGTPTIAVASKFPAATVPVSIDGTTQPGGWVDLAAPDVTFNGLDLRGGASQVKGMQFEGFNNALVIAGKGNDLVSGNRFGVNTAGTAAARRPVTAVLVGDGTDMTVSDNVILTTGIGIQAIQGAAGTISGNRIGVSADGNSALSPLPPNDILLRDVGVFTVQNNTVAAATFGILLRGASAPGTVITGNHIGTNGNGTAKIGSFGVGVVIDAVSHATVSDNFVSVGRPADAFSADVMVTGMAQCPAGGCFSPDAATNGPITGGDVTNGLSASAAGVYGVLVYAFAPRVTIDSNIIAGHFDQNRQVAEVELLGAADAIVGSNTIGTNELGTAAIRADVGVDVVGSSGTTIHDNLIAAASTAAIMVSSPDAGTVGAQVKSSATTIRDNRIGVNRAGTAAIANDVGIIVTGESADTVIGPTNLISGNTHAGILLRGAPTGTVISNDTIGANAAGNAAISNEFGIDIDELVDKTTISGSLIAGNTKAGIRTVSTSLVTVTTSEIGRRKNNVTIANGLGVDAQGPTNLSADTVKGNIGAGVKSKAGFDVFVSASTTFSDNGDIGIIGAGEPAAPTIDAVITKSANGTPRVQFVITSPGSSRQLGVAAIYSNTDCTTQGNAQTSVTTKAGSFLSPTAAVLTPTSNVIAAAYTATVTAVSALSGTGDLSKPVGRTSPISYCVLPHEYPDTSGTGVPDIIQKALGGDPTKPSTVRFLGTDGNSVSLVTSQGKFTGVTASDSPALPAGVSQPSGPFAFTIKGVHVGGAVQVSVAVGGTAVPTTNAYWRYGPPVPGGTTQWYRWEFDAASGLGPQQNGTGWILNFVDGQSGDDDATANGTIVDPGAPAIDTNVVTPADTVPAAAAVNALASTGPPRTQSFTLAGLLAMVAGTALCLLARERRGRYFSRGRYTALHRA
jgi:CSLREA domain-containing protein